MANIKRLKKTSNIILLAVMLCCIGGCFSLASHDANQDKEIEADIRKLPLISTPEDIAEAVNSPETRMYLFVFFKFPKLEYVTDPADHFGAKYLYLQYTKSKHHDRVIVKGRVKKEARWTTEEYKHYYGTPYINKETELEGFAGAEFGGCSENSFESGKYKHEYKYITASDLCTFVAELGQHRAKLGYKGNPIFVKGDIETFVNATTKEMSHYFLGFFLFIAVLGISYYVINDVTKH